MKFFSRIIVLILGILIAAIFLLQGSIRQENWTAEWKKLLKKFPPSPGAVELKEILSFGDSEEKDRFLWSPRVMALDAEGNTYVIDSKWCSLFKFDATGRFVAKAGRKGQGPGEFQNPVWIGLHNSRIFICDNGKHALMTFDLDLTFQNSTMIRDSYYSLAISSQGLICAVPMRWTKAAPLIHILDEKGNLLRAFGKGLFGNENKWLTPNLSYIDVNQKDEIYLAFECYPTVCKFTLSGELIARYEIDSEWMKDAGKRNDEAISDPNNRVSWTAIYGLRALDDGFCLLQGYPYTGIREFDGQGKPVAEYWTARTYDYFERDFVVRKKGQMMIYILTSGPRARVELFQPKK